MAEVKVEANTSQPSTLRDAFTKSLATDEKVSGATEGIGYALAELSGVDLERAARRISAAASSVSNFPTAPSYRAPDGNVLHEQGLTDEQIHRVTAEHALAYIKNTALTLPAESQKQVLHILDATERSLPHDDIMVDL